MLYLVLFEFDLAKLFVQDLWVRIGPRVAPLWGDSGGDSETLA
jgi:hypothetical protein